ncbi:MAG: T9SS type A sorting domain-containing protein [Ekhidna sp.]
MAARIKLYSILLVLALSSYAQELVCGTEATPRDIEALKDLDVESFVNARSSSADPIRIAITAHVARRSDGTGGLSEFELAAAIADANQIYTLTNMEFFIFGDINYIDSDKYFDFSSSMELEVAEQHFVENTINVYFFNSALSGENSVCGYARFPQSGIDRIVMVNSCTTNGSTFPHELGHYFALYHTHGKTNNGTTDELVTRDGGANCATAGDDLCDTAADPRLSGLVSTSCTYTGDAKDANGETFRPNPRNLMSYSRKECRDQFTQGQADRIVAAHQQYKTYLYDKNYLADFDVVSREVCQNGTLEFVDKSVNAASYEWTFEGGTPAVSGEANPTIEYATLGTYDVTLVITDAEGGMDTKTFENLVTVRSEVTTDKTSIAGSFEEATLTETIYNYDESETWKKTTAAFSDGTSSVYMNFADYNSVGSNDYLVIDALDASTEKVFALNFDYAYAPYNEQYFDGLEIVYREPCGTWKSAWLKEGFDLATVASQENLFTPTSDQWKTETVIFEVDPSINVVEVAFKSINGYGNNLYLDNYSIDTFDPSFEILDIQITNTSCPNANNGAIDISASSNSELDYSIDGEKFVKSNVIENLFTGTYNVIVRNVLGDQEVQEVVVASENVFPDTPVIELIGGEITVTSGGKSYQWYKDGQYLDGATSASYSFESGGKFIVYVSNGECGVFSEPFLVLSADAVDSNLKVFPNPAEDYISISLPSKLQKEVNKITVNDVSGRKILEYQYEERLDVSALETGLYILHFELEGEKVNRRFLKQ